MRDADGELLRGFMHPPGMPLMPRDARDFVRIEGSKAFRCVVEVPMADFGIERAGVFSVFGFWAGTSSTVPTVGSKYKDHFEHAEATYLTVIDDKAAGVGLRPSLTTPDRDLPTCVATD